MTPAPVTPAPVTPAPVTPAPLCRRNRRGTAAIEFALVGSVLLVMIFGMMEWSWYLFQYYALERATEQGARVASAVTTNQDPTPVAQAAVERALREWGVNPSSVAVETELSGETGSQVVSVDVTLGNATLIGLVPSPRSAHAHSSQHYEEAQPR